LVVKFRVEHERLRGSRNGHSTRRYVLSNVCRVSRPRMRASLVPAVTRSLRGLLAWTRSGASGSGHMHRLRLAVMAMASLTGACGGSTTDSSGVRGSGGAHHADGAVGAGPGGTAGTTGTGGTASAGASGGSGTSGFDAGAAPRGCSPASPCGEYAYCDYPDDRCGRSGVLGVCKNGITPPGCSGLGPPTCGCNGKTYASECLAHMGEIGAEGVDADIEGGCMVPPGEFACGPWFCLVAESYCQRQVTDVSGVPDSFSCQPLPAPCVRSMSCACLAGVYCGDRCEEDVGGGLTVTCPGG
jgi:hypothetical protein